MMEKTTADPVQEHLKKLESDVEQVSKINKHLMEERKALTFILERSINVKDFANQNCKKCSGSGLLGIKTEGKHRKPVLCYGAGCSLETLRMADIIVKGVKKGGKASPFKSETKWFRINATKFNDIPVHLGKVFAGICPPGKKKCKDKSIIDCWKCWKEYLTDEWKDEENDR